MSRYLSSVSLSVRFLFLFVSIEDESILADADLAFTLRRSSICSYLCNTVLDMSVLHVCVCT